jgi:hypothetical protein
MNNTSITTATLDPIDEEILTTTVSDETLEAIASPDIDGPIARSSIPDSASNWHACC